MLLSIRRQSTRRELFVSSLSKSQVFGFRTTRAVFAGGRLVRDLDIWDLLLRTEQMSGCKIEGCANQTKLTYGMCAAHYQKWKKYGDPLATRRHGHSPRGARSSEYGSWVHMKQRCLNPHHESYSRYGGRGISVYSPWVESFASFCAYMGPKPTPKHTIDRYPDNDGNYEPGNVRWATMAEQNRNRADTVKITVGDTTLCQLDWATTQGITAEAVRNRLRRGLTPEQSIVPYRMPAKNTRLPKRNSTGFKGVILSECGTFIARVGGKALGTFNNVEDAAHAYDAKAREVFGADAFLNFPEPHERSAR